MGAILMTQYATKCSDSVYFGVADRATDDAPVVLEITKRGEVYYLSFYVHDSLVHRRCFSGSTVPILHKCIDTLFEDGANAHTLWASDIFSYRMEDEKK